MSFIYISIIQGGAREPDTFEIEIKLAHLNRLKKSIHEIKVER